MEPIDPEGSYVYSFGGVTLFLYPDDVGDEKLTWAMWGTAAYGLGTFVARQHFDKEFQFMVLQDWPPGQRDTQRYLGKGAVMVRGSSRSLKGYEDTVGKVGNTARVTA